MNALSAQPRLRNIALLLGLAWLVVVVQLHIVSVGGWEGVHWLSMSPPDLLFSFLKTFMMATAIVTVGMYYGYRARGGPVGVGTATGRSMMVNLVLVHIIGMAGTVLFWGGNPRFAIGG